MLKFEEKIKEQNETIQNTKGLKRIRKWLNDISSFKFMVNIEELYCSVYENWLKFKTSIFKYLSSQQEKILQYLSRLKKQMKWIVQVIQHKTPQVDLISSRLYKQCEDLVIKNNQINMKSVKNKCKMICEKIHDSAKKFVQSCGNTIQKFTKDIKKTVCMKNIMNQQTFFYFHENLHNRKIIIQSPQILNVDNKSYDMDFGGVVCPYFSQHNNKIKFRIDGNNFYQSFIGLGVCHPKIIKKANFRTSGPDSGCYILRQESNCQNLLILNHAYERQGSISHMKSLKWGFTVGDIIQIQIDYKKSKAIFKKDQNTYTMKLDLDQGEIAPYVVLHSTSDTVSIINK